jgi:hypothetical protein
VVDGVTTLNPGEPAAVQTSFDGSNVRFTFGIPRGNDGSNGNDGSPGEVSQAQLDNAISGTSANTNSVGTLDSGFADADMESLRQKMNELITALLRQLVRHVQQAVEIIRQTDVTGRALHLRQTVEGGAKPGAQGGQCHPHLVEQGPYRAALLIEQGKHEVGWLQDGVIAT